MDGVKKNEKKNFSCFVLLHVWSDLELLMRSEVRALETVVAKTIPNVAIVNAIIMS